MDRRLFIVLLLTSCIGCGTTRWTDTKRTGTEQLLVSDAIDRAVSNIDFSILAGRDVFLDASHMADAVDKDYLISTLRQHMIACGLIIKDKREEATFVVEARAGAIGTDRHDLLYGMPAMQVPTTLPGVPSSLPEIAAGKRTDQQGVAKIAVFAYHRETGRPIWQSGNEQVASNTHDLWVLGVGPFQHGTIYDHAQFAGSELRVPLLAGQKTHDAAEKTNEMRVTRTATFANPNVFPNAVVVKSPTKTDKPDSATAVAKSDKPAESEKSSSSSSDTSVETASFIQPISFDGLLPAKLAARLAPDPQPQPQPTARLFGPPLR